MSWLVVWFRDGEIYKATVCRSRRVLTKIANQHNEYAQMYNRSGAIFGGNHLHTVGIISSKDALDIVFLHQGLPKHTPREKLERAKKIRHLVDLPVRVPVQ